MGNIGPSCFRTERAVRCALNCHFCHGSHSKHSLGTKLYQATRKAITKRQPALLHAISKFNDLCLVLEELRPAGCNIPIPAALSTKLNDLRDDPSLHEDVWIKQTQGDIPRWLNDEDVRDGIQSLHSLDRCREEGVRLRREGKNMQEWLDDEVAIVSHAMEISTGALGAQRYHCLFISQ